MDVVDLPVQLVKNKTTVQPSLRKMHQACYTMIKSLISRFLGGSVPKAYSS